MLYYASFLVYEFLGDLEGKECENIARKRKHSSSAIGKNKTPFSFSGIKLILLLFIIVIMIGAITFFMFRGWLTFNIIY